jgi:hypothetical protein
MLVEHDRAQVGAPCRHRGDPVSVPLRSREGRLQQVLGIVRRPGEHDG